LLWELPHTPTSKPQAILHHPELHPEHREEQMRKFQRFRALKWGAIGVVIVVVILELATN
jgi:hypothetical protein